LTAITADYRTMAGFDSVLLNERESLSVGTM